VVPDGPRAHRRDLRTQGPWAALVAPAVAGLVASVLLWNSVSAWRGALGLLLAVAAAPLLPLFGAPLVDGTRMLAAVAASAALWCAIGTWSARRATRNPVASWPEWRREYRRLALGAAGGGLGALALAGLVLAVVAS
jgi:hypothetical protein